MENRRFAIRWHLIDRWQIAERRHIALGMRVITFEVSSLRSSYCKYSAPSSEDSQCVAERVSSFMRHIMVGLAYCALDLDSLFVKHLIQLDNQKPFGIYVLATYHTCGQACTRPCRSARDGWIIVRFLNVRTCQNGHVDDPIAHHLHG